MNLNFDDNPRAAEVSRIRGRLYRFRPAGEDEVASSGRAFSAPGAAARDELPYRVELWDAAKSSVEQVLAVTANGSIGFAAFYAATREFPDRYITLRHQNSILSRWNGPQN